MLVNLNVSFSRRQSVLTCLWMVQWSHRAACWLRCKRRAAGNTTTCLHYSESPYTPWTLSPAPSASLGSPVTTQAGCRPSTKMSFQYQSILWLLYFASQFIIMNIMIIMIMTIIYIIISLAQYHEHALDCDSFVAMSLYIYLHISMDTVAKFSLKWKMQFHKVQLYYCLPAVFNCLYPISTAFLLHTPCTFVMR